MLAVKLNQVSQDVKVLKKHLDLRKLVIYNAQFPHVYH